MLNLLPKHSGIYFVEDNINNLQFKIHFRSINTLLNLPSYNITEYNNKESVTEQENNENALSNEKKVILIKWQEKIFSSSECELYSDLKNCINDQQKQYHQILKAFNRDRKLVKKKRQRKQAKAEIDPSIAKGNFIFTYVNEDNVSASVQLVRNMKSQIKSYTEETAEEMYVYAALNPDTQLVAIRWFNKARLLYIYPDFTGSQNQPYSIEVDSDYRHLYSYGIEDVSCKDLASLNNGEQFLYLPELPTHWRVEEELAKQFSAPPRRTHRCAIIFTVNTVSSFEYDNLHIRYHIKLPKDTILEEGLLDATSHSTSSCNTNSALHIGLTWQITVLCEEQFDPSQHLHIFFEVISIDSWERERTEGFSHYSLSLLLPCQSTIKLNCVRPVETLLGNIKRYFIGGHRKFNYVRFICEREGEKKEGASNFHSRYGERMQTSGQISLCYQVLIQRSCELLKPCSNRTSGMTLDDIMMAYKVARRRLEAVTLN